MKTGMSKQSPYKVPPPPTHAGINLSRAPKLRSLEDCKTPRHNNRAYCPVKRPPTRVGKDGLSITLTDTYLGAVATRNQ